MNRSMAARVLIVAFCLTSLPATAGESPPVSANAYDLLHQAGGFEGCGRLLEQLRNLPPQDANAIDNAWPLIEALNFGMAQLLTEAELRIILADIESSSSTLDRFLSSYFRITSGDARVPRRVLFTNKTATVLSLEELAESPDALARVCALTAICRHDTSKVDGGSAWIATAQVDAFNGLIELAPQSRSVIETLLHMLGTHLSEGANISDSAESFVASYAWSDSATTLITNNEVTRDLLSRLTADEAVAVLTDAALNHADEHVRRMSIRVLAAHGGVEAVPESAGSALLARGRMGAAIESNKLDTAYGIFRQTIGPNNDNELVTSLNSLSMALVRANRADEAIEVFATLAGLYPGSYLESVAEGHIEHLAAANK